MDEALLSLQFKPRTESSAKRKNLPGTRRETPSLWSYLTSCLSLLAWDEALEELDCGRSSNTDSSADMVTDAAPGARLPPLSLYFDSFSRKLP